VAQPGAQTRIGIQFETDKDWHIYWKNPGDSGEPPRVRWQLPEGVTAGPIQWPAPTRMNNSAGTDYGYQGNAVLLSTLNTPKAVQPGSSVVIADLRWLVCHDVCIPQHAELRARMRISNNATIDQRVHELLDTAAKRIPKPLPDSLHLTATSSRDHLLLSIASNNNIAHATFFPTEPEQIDNAAPQGLANDGSIVRLELKKSDHLLRDPESLEGVLVLNEQDSYQIDVPLHRETAHKERKR
jgi:thiol:disulfide interchange protein DsbD